jgi:thioredoxin reductase (NADPH)
MKTNVEGVYLAGTVIGGTQEKYRVFLENCHVHVERIVAALQGGEAPVREVVFAQPES